MSGAGVVPPVSRAHARAVVMDVLAELPAQLRAVLVEVYLRGRTPAEVADAFGVSQALIGRRTLDAMRMLESLLVQRGLSRAPD
jgi:DNA-directed RNA polymerase specialized sigma24 family protein